MKTENQVTSISTRIIDALARREQAWQELNEIAKEMGYYDWHEVELKKLNNIKDAYD